MASEAPQEDALNATTAAPPTGKLRKSLIILCLVVFGVPTFFFFDGLMTHGVITILLSGLIFFGLLMVAQWLVWHLFAAPFLLGHWLARTLRH